jgi:predicted phage tail protein
MDSKSIFLSKTFWGAALAFLAYFTPHWGITLDVEGWSNDIVSLLGAGMVLWGRFTATVPVKLL